MDAYVKEIETVYFETIKRLSIQATKREVNRDYRAMLKREGVFYLGF